MVRESSTTFRVATGGLKNPQKMKTQATRSMISQIQLSPQPPVPIFIKEGRITWEMAVMMHPIATTSELNLFISLFSRYVKKNVNVKIRMTGKTKYVKLMESD